MQRPSCKRRRLSSGSSLVLPSCMGSSEPPGGADELFTGRKRGERHEEETAADCPLWPGGKTAELDLSLSLSKRRLSILIESEIKVQVLRKL